MIIPLLFVGCSLASRSKSGREHYFLTQVKPVLQEHCLRCHNGTLPSPALNLSSNATAFIRSATGRDYILPADPDCSLLVSAIQRGGTHSKMMPRTEVSLTDDQIGMLREWIEDGAYWPTDASGNLKAQKSAENP